MTLFDLVAKLSLDSSQYESGIASASNTASSFAQKLGHGLGTAAKVGAAAVTAVATAAVAVGSAITKAVGDVASYGDNIDKMSQKMNLSAEAFQEWDAVMQHAGTSIESLQASMKTLANAAETDSEAFAQLGITQEQIASMSNEELFSATITALQKVEDETERTYLAGKLLGRGATELGPLLNMSAEETQQLKDRVHELGGVMSDEAVKAAAAYADSLQDMKTAISGLKNSFTSQLLPSFTKVMDGITEVFAGDATKGVEMISEGVDNAISTLDKMIPKALDIGGKIISGIGKAIQKNLPKLLKSGAQIVQKLATSIVQALPEMLRAGTQAIASLIQGITEELPNAIPQAVEAIMDIVDALTDPDNMSALLDAGLQMIVTLADSLIDSLPLLVERLPQIIDNIVTGLVDAAPKLVDAATQIIVALASYLSDPANQAQLLSAAGQIVQALLSGIVQLAGGLADAGLTLIDSLVGGLMNAIGLGGLYNAASEAVHNFLQGLRDNTANNFVPLCNEVISNLANDLANADTIGEVFQAGVNAANEFIRGMYETMPELFGLLAGILNAGNPAAATMITSYAEGLAADARNETQQAIAEQEPIDVSLPIDAEPWYESLTPVGQAAADALANSFTEKADPAMREASGLLPITFTEEFSGHYGEFETDGQAAGEAVGKGIVSGIDLSKSSAIQAAIDLANSVLSAFKSTLGIASPSKVTRRFGQYFSQGFSIGIVDELETIAEAAREASQTALDQLQTPEVSTSSYFSESAEAAGLSAPHDPWAQVAKLLTEIRDNIGEFGTGGGDVVLDSGKIVGFIDGALGQRSARKARGTAWA